MVTIRKWHFDCLWKPECFAPGYKRDDLITNVLLPFRPMVENSSHPLFGWSLTGLLPAAKHCRKGEPPPLREASLMAKQIHRQILVVKPCSQNFIVRYGNGSIINR